MTLRPRTSFRWLVFVAAVFALTSCSGPQQTPKRVIWLAIDSLSAQRLGFMGYPRATSPWLDALAAQSVVFERAFAPSNVTPRSVAASMTGRHYSHLQRDLYEQRLPAEFTTLAEWFRQLGFRTTAFNTNPLLRAETGFARGFDAYHDLIPDDATKATLSELIDAVRGAYQPTGEREFLYLHTMDVHHPYTPPARDALLFQQGEYRGSAVVDGNLQRPDGDLVFGNLPYFQQSQRIDEADIAHLSGLHEGTIHYTDRLLPELLEALHFDPARDLLLISADHGEQLFEHGYWRHGRSMLPEEIHVPLLVRWDGFAAHSVATAVSLVDWFPTFARLFGEPVPESLAGRSLLLALSGKALTPRPVYSEAHVYDASGAAVVDGEQLYWLCSDNSKLTPWIEWPYAERLCDLRSDPRCEDDLSKRMPREAERLNALLRELNPVWQSFTSEAVQPPQRALDRGPQLLRDVPAAPVSQASGAPPLRFRATLDEPARSHLLELDYRLSAGELEIALLTRADGRVLWRHRILHPSNEWQTLRAKLEPGISELVLRVRTRAGGTSWLRAVALQRLMVPELPIHVWPGAASVEGDQGSPTDDEAARLRALGYLE